MKEKLLKILFVILCISSFTSLQAQSYDYLALVGDATSAGYNPYGTIDTRMEETSPGVWKWEGSLKGSGLFKIHTVEGDWCDGEWLGPVNNEDVLPATPYPYNNWNGCDEDLKWAVPADGFYAITVDTNAGMIISEELTHYPNLYLIGSATVSDWDAGQSREMTQEPSNPAIFTWEGNLDQDFYNGGFNDAEFKILSVRTSEPGWDEIRATSAYEDPLSSNSFVVEEGGTGNDDQWQITDANRGSYRITLNLDAQTINFERLNYYPNLYVVGDATTKGFDPWSEDLKFTQDETDPELFSYRGEFNPGGFKIHTYVGDWGWGDYIVATAADQDISATDYEINRQEQGNDYKWAITQAGMYTITLDQASNTINIILDTDGDGTKDSEDAFPEDPTEDTDTDNDGIGNNADPDDDGDGQTDEDEIACGSDPLDSSSMSPDTDEDGIPDCVDSNDDTDTDGDGIPDVTDPDDDGDGQTDEHEIECGSDPLDASSISNDTDGDGIPNCVDSDDDGDGVIDEEDDFSLDPTEDTDTDNDGIGNNADPDDDGDGQLDEDELACGSDPLDPLSMATDTNGDGTPDCKEEIPYQYLALVGDGTSAGWNPYGTIDTRMEMVSSGVWKWEGTLKGSGTFKIHTVEGDWCDGQWLVPANDEDILSSTAYSYNVSFGCEANDNNWAVPEDGSYAITVDTNTGTIVSEELTHLSNLYIIGSATVSDWSADLAREMTQDASNPAIFTWEGNLDQNYDEGFNNGEFKILSVRTFEDGWDEIRATSANADPLSSNSFVVEEGGTGNDYKWQITDANRGSYRITLNLDSEEINFERLDYYPNLYVVGDATAKGFYPWSEDLKFTQNETNPELFSYRGEFTPGSFKIHTYIGDFYWGDDIVPSAADQDISASDYEINRQGQGNDFKWSITEAGIYTITLDQATNTINIILDTDGDGTKDSEDAFPEDPTEDTDTDEDGIGNNEDPDDDGDGQTDEDELACGSNPLDPSSISVDTDGDGIPDCLDPDNDGDGVPDEEDAFPLDPNEDTDTDNDGVGNNEDPDDDGDGQTDEYEIECGSDPLDATSISDDTDNDGIPDCVDSNDDTDTDSDGTPDVSDPDDDGDGQTDEHENECGSDPLDASSISVDTDGDRIPDCVDPDDDGDGQTDEHELECGSDPLDPSSMSVDTDGDGIPDCVDPDNDGDSVPDEDDAFPLDPTEDTDTDNDGLGNNADPDDDGDGQTDEDEIACGSDPLEASSVSPDTDNDGIPDCVDTDDDGDGVIDENDAFPLDASENTDTDNDGIGNNEDPDDDGDEQSDEDEIACGSDPLDVSSVSIDTDNDGIPDCVDPDDDGDGVEDSQDECPNTDPDAVVGLNGCEIFSLPLDNYTVESTNTTCNGKTNGKIRVSAAASGYNYMVSIPDHDPVSLPDTYSLDYTFTGLAPGIYPVCFTIEGQEDYKQCFEVKINEPEAVMATTEIDYNASRMKIRLDGPDKFYVSVNNKVRILTAGTYEIDLKNGMNEISITGEQECQGEYFERIFVSEAVRLYPNPSSGPVQIYIPGLDNSVDISVLSLNGAQVWIDKVQVNDSRVIEINLGHLEVGTYILKINGEETNDTLKVIIK